MSRSSELPDRELEGYIDDAAAVVLITAPQRSRVMLWVAVLFVGSALVWANWAELDEVTRGEGRVIPSQQVQVVQYLEGGILKEIFVSEGDRVSKGQPLLRIDDTRFRSDFRERAQEEAFLASTVSRLRAELGSVRISREGRQVSRWSEWVLVEEQELAIGPEVETRFPDLVARARAQYRSQLVNLKNQMQIIERQIEQKEQEKREINSNIRHLRTSYELGLEELNLTRPLANEGVVPRVELIKLEREVNRLKSDLDAARLALPKVQYALEEQVHKRSEIALQFLSESQRQLNEAEAKLAQLNEAQVNLRDRVDRTLVVSPVEGTVKTLAINTVGGVVQPGMDLIEIVPAEDSLVVEANILPKDIAFLRPGLEAVVRFSAYDFAIYGGLKGRLEHISADSIADEKGNTYYLIRVRTDRNFLGSEVRPLPIIPGMTASIDVLTGKKSVMDYLLKPILRAKESALRER